MKKILLGLFALFISLNSSSALSASISVDMISGGTIDNSLSLSSGSTFDVDIVINDVIDIAGFEFILGFDSTVLSATSITSGDIFGLDTFLIDDTINANSVSFSETTFAFFGLDINTQTVLATISFDAIAAGTSDLLLSNIFLSDSFAFEITPVTIADANITIPGTSTIPEPSVLWLLFFGLIGGIAINRKQHSNA